MVGYLLVVSNPDLDEIIAFLSYQISPLSACGSYAALTLMRGSILGQMVRRAIRMS